MKRAALFVGVNRYEDPEISNLNCAESDATELYAFFKHGAGYDDVRHLLSPDSDELLDTAQQMVSHYGPDDTFLLFFAGHGVEYEGRHLLLCPKARYSRLKYHQHAIPIDLLKEETATDGLNRVFILDACRSDLLAGTRSAGVSGMRDVQCLKDVANEKILRGSLSILCSCDEGEQAREIAECQQGLFSKALLTVLEARLAEGVAFDLSDVAIERLLLTMQDLAATYRLACQQRPWVQRSGGVPYILFGTTEDEDRTALDRVKPERSEQQLGASVEDKQKAVRETTVGGDTPGAFMSIQEALEHTIEGGVVTISPGEYREVVRISQTVILRGTASDECVISSPGSGPDTAAILIESCSGVEIENLTLRGMSEISPNGIAVRHASAKICNCIIENFHKAGISIEHGKSDGLIVACRCSGNNFGITLYQTSRWKLERNILISNGKVGLRLDNSEDIVVAANRCDTNKYFGIALVRDSTAELLDNKCSSNEGGNILISDHGSRGRCIRNRCEGSMRGAGIQVEKGAELVAQANTCNKNHLAGIYVAETATGTLESNMCERNASTGIYSEGAGIARKNQCIENGSVGIIVQGRDCDFSCEGNGVLRNSAMGIFYGEKSRGCVSGNRISKNDGAGIQVQGDGASPTIQGNSISGNSGFAIFIARGTQATVGRNEMDDNETDKVVRDEPSFLDPVIKVMKWLKSD